MIRIQQLKLPVTHTEEELVEKIASRSLPGRLCAVLWMPATRGI